MKIKYSGKDDMNFILAFSTTTYGHLKKGAKGFFIEIFRHRWDFIYGL